MKKLHAHSPLCSLVRVSIVSTLRQELVAGLKHRSLTFFDEFTRIMCTTFGHCRRLFAKYRYRSNYVRKSKTDLVLPKSTLCSNRYFFCICPTNRYRRIARKNHSRTQPTTILYVTFVVFFWWFVRDFLYEPDFHADLYEEQPSVRVDPKDIRHLRIRFYL